MKYWSETLLVKLLLIAYCGTIIRYLILNNSCKTANFSNVVQEEIENTKYGNNIQKTSPATV